MSISKALNHTDTEHRFTCPYCEGKRGRRHDFAGWIECRKCKGTGKVERKVLAGVIPECREKIKSWEKDLARMKKLVAKWEAELSGGGEA
jgi:hypothetical protein